MKPSRQTAKRSSPVQISGQKPFVLPESLQSLRLHILDRCCVIYFATVLSKTFYAFHQRAFKCHGTFNGVSIPALVQTTFSSSSLV